MNKLFSGNVKLVLDKHTLIWLSTLQSAPQHYSQPLNGFLLSVPVWC